MWGDDADRADGSERCGQASGIPTPPPTNVGGGWAGISHKPYNGARAPAFFSLTCTLNLHPTLNPTEMQALINRQPERTYTPNPP